MTISVHDAAKAWQYQHAAWTEYLTIGLISTASRTLLALETYTNINLT